MHKGLLSEEETPCIAGPFFLGTNLIIRKGNARADYERLEGCARVGSSGRRCELSSTGLSISSFHATLLKWKCIELT